MWPHRGVRRLHTSLHTSLLAQCLPSAPPRDSMQQNGPPNHENGVLPRCHPASSIVLDFAIADFKVYRGLGPSSPQNLGLYDIDFRPVRARPFKTTLDFPKPCFYQGHLEIPAFAHDPLEGHFDRPWSHRIPFQGVVPETPTFRVSHTLGRFCVKNQVLLRFWEVFGFGILGGLIPESVGFRKF